MEKLAEAQKLPRKRRRKKAEDYGVRNQILSALGFGSYSEYLRSTLWQTIRSAVFRRFPQCVLCDGVPTQIHHVDYSIRNLSGESCIGLRALCADCHRRVEFDGDRKLSLTEAREKYKKIEKKVRYCRRKREREASNA